MANDQYDSLMEIDKLEKRRLEIIKTNKELYSLFLQNRENEFIRDIGEMFMIPFRGKTITLKVIDGNCDSCYFYDGRDGCILEYKDRLILGGCIGTAFEIVNHTLKDR